MTSPSQPETWPISKCTGPALINWEFVEEFSGTYEEAMGRAKALQEMDEPWWEYRIWDCR